MHKHVALAMMAERAYQEHTRSVGELEYLLDTVQGYPAIAIRGTEGSAILKGRNWLDLVRDIRILPWYDKDIGWAHAGMLKGAQRIYKDLFISGIAGRTFIRAPYSKRLYVTGHSLGGGVGFLLAKLVNNRLKSCGVDVVFVGFGTPNVMISDPVVTFPATFYRNGDDVVTELLGHGLYKPFPQIQIGDSEGWEPIDDHTDMRGYVRAVEEYLTY